jgi:Ankyrin repeats (3 copies)
MHIKNAARHQTRKMVTSTTTMNKAPVSIDDGKIVHESRIRWRFYRPKVDSSKISTKLEDESKTLGSSTLHSTTRHTRQESLVHDDENDTEAKSILDMSVHTNGSSSHKSSSRGNKLSVGRVIGRTLFKPPQKSSKNSNKNNNKTSFDDLYFPEDGEQFNEYDNGNDENQNIGSGIGGVLSAFPSVPTISPKEYCKTLLHSLGYVDYRYRVLDSGYNNQPTSIQLASYNDYIVKLVDNKKIHDLKDCLLSGISCNPVKEETGDTLCHYICYKGNVAMLDILLQCCNETIGTDYSPLQTCNYKGRTPLHDACSAPTLNLGIIEIILKYDPNLLFMADKNDTLPIEYIRQEHWSEWIDFLTNKLHIFFPKRNTSKELDISKPKPQPIPPLVSVQPHSRPFPDPPIYLAIQIIELIANGTMRPSLIQFSNNRHTDNDDNNTIDRDSMAVSALTEPVLDYQSSFYEDYDDDDDFDEDEDDEFDEEEMNEEDVAAFVQAFYSGDEAIDDNENDSINSRLSLIREIANAKNRQSIVVSHFHKKK